MTSASFGPSVTRGVTQALQLQGHELHIYIFILKEVSSGTHIGRTPAELRMAKAP